MLKKWTAAVLCAALLFTFAAACGRSNDISSGAEAKDFPVTVGNVTIGSEPKGAAVLSPNAADVVLALGYELALKAKSASCTQADLAALPVVTADDAGKIKSYGADLVFADAALTKDQQAAMDRNGIAVVVLKPASSRSDLQRLYCEVGSALKGGSTGYGKGKTIAAGVFETIDDVTRSVPKRSTPVTAVYLYNAQGSAATGDTIAGSLVKSSGLQNVAEDAAGGKYSVETLLLSNPQYIFCAKGVKAKLTSGEQFKRLGAVKTGKIYEMDPTLMALQGEQMINAVSFMAGTVYPELLKNASSAASSAVSSAVSANGMNLNQTLKFGMQSGDVMKLQKRLEELGYMFVEPTGLYAEGTQQSVKDFQYLNGLTVTGVADPETLKLIFSNQAKKRTQ
jgi:ABC-type Fe3+-hydroxamate transport system substrate-binding protein